MTVNTHPTPFSRAMQRTALALSLFAGLAAAGAAAPGNSAGSLDLPATAIFSKGPNDWDGDILNITKGRGSNIGWYIYAKEGGEVTVTIHYSNARPLNQAYQISFDGQDRFWDVPVTGDKAWAEATLGTFQLRGGVPVMIILVPPSNKKFDHPVRFKKLTLQGGKPGNLALYTAPAPPPAPASSPGFGKKVAGLHPALAVADLRPHDTTWRVSGMARRGESELLFSTWEGDVFALELDADLAAAAKRGALPYRRIAQGLSEPMGLAVSNRRIFVTEKNQVTELIDDDGDGIIDTYRCVSHDWPCSLDYHEYLFGAVIEGSHIYFASSTGMAVRNVDNQQAPLRGSVVKVHLDTGETEIVAGGLRTPNGIGFGPGGAMFITDNQGEWLPASKLVKVEPKAFFHFRSTPPRHPFDRPDPTPPAVWLPQGEISASPTQPVLLPESWGPYAGQMLYGDVTYGGLQRVFLEEIDGVTQGAAFQFSQGFQHHFNRLVLGRDGTLYGGGIARGTNWEFIERVSGLTRIKLTEKEVFEPLAVRIRSNGLELELTRPLAAGRGWDPAGYYVTQWGYQAAQTYGGAKVRHRRGEVRSASVSDDRRRVFLELPDLVAGEVIHVRLPESLESADGGALWAGETWYTVNRIPVGRPGAVRPRPANVVATATPYFRFEGGDVGGTLFQNFCAACHSTDGSPLVGPSLQGLLGARRRVVEATSGAVKDVSVDHGYIRQSIVEPNALVVEGYQDIMPSLGAALSDADVEALVDYVVRISRDGAGRAP